jgi:hypothetical protein
MRSPARQGISKEYIYPAIFSTAYALIVGLTFYPGLLYSDSVGRWDNAILLAANGLKALSYLNDYYPVVPIFIMAPFYAVTGEIGLFHIIQVFLFSYTLFMFSEIFYSGLLRNIIVSLILVLPINIVYSVFSSYDTLFAILLLNLCIFLLKRNKTTIDAVVISALAAMAIGTRHPAAVLLPVVVCVIYTRRNTFVRSRSFYLSLILSASLCTFAIFLPKMLGLHPINQAMGGGVAWEYANYATKSNQERDILFLKSIGADAQSLRNDICYHGIYCGQDGVPFIDKIQPNRQGELFRNYFMFIKDHPGTFLTEKMKYIMSLMGIDSPLYEGSIEKWREPDWAKRMERLNFHSDARKVTIVDLYKRFSAGIGRIFFRPWIVFLLLYAMSVYLYRHNPMIIGCTIIVTAYYGAYFITSQSHELRYFFPVDYFFMAYVSASSPLIIRPIYRWAVNLASILKLPAAKL